MRKTVAVLLAGGVGSRLSVLAQVRAKPAVTFGGIYRIIDFTLSNIANSGIENVGILTQYKPYSLMKHIGTGAPWDFIGRSRLAKILPPKTGLRDSDWYRGTADAVAQNMDFIQRFNAEQVIILSGDHIYYMDYARLIDFHKQKKAKLTIATRVIPLDVASEFGIAQVDNDSKIIDWEEKPENPKSNLASMGIYVFDAKFLEECLHQVEGFDFGNHVIPWALKNYTAYAYPFDDYWQDVGTIKAYWDANMHLLTPNSGLNLETWQVLTNPEDEEIKRDRAPAYFSNTAIAKNSIISHDCQIEGEVINSIISPGVRISEGAKVVDSIIMHDTYLDKNVILNQTIVDKKCFIGAGAQIGVGEDVQPNTTHPKYLNAGISLIGKSAKVKPGVKLGRNCLVYYNVSFNDFKEVDYKSGSTIYYEPDTRVFHF